MGFKRQNLSRQCQRSSYKHNLQNYYCQLYDKYLNKYKNSQEDVAHILSSIFSRTKLHTNTKRHRELCLLDIDKIMSLANKSLLDNGDEIKMMRMVVGLKQQSDSTRQDSTNLRQIHNLVRMARLHFMSVRRQRLNDSEQQQQTIPQDLARLEQELNQN